MENISPDAKRVVWAPPQARSERRRSPPRYARTTASRPDEDLEDELSDGERSPPGRAGASAALARPRGGSARPHDDELIGARLGAPDLALAAVQLPHGRVGARKRQAYEAPGRRIEPDNCVRAEVAQPHLVPLVDVDGVRHWVRARQTPLAPGAPARVVAADLAGVPLADPDPPARVRPGAPRTLVSGRRPQHDRGAAAHVDPAEVAPGKRGVVDDARRRRRDPVRSGSTRRAVDPELPRTRVEAAVDPALAGEPEPSAAVERRRVQVRVARLRREPPAADTPRARIDADDRVEAAVGDPRCAVGPHDHAVRCRAGPERDVQRLSRLRVQMSELARRLCRVPDAAVPRRRDVVRVLAGWDRVLLDAQCDRAGKAASRRPGPRHYARDEIGRASCRERV